MVASSHLVHNSIEELNRAISAADTTLNNAINAFGQLNYTKFLENVKIFSSHLIIFRLWRMSQRLRSKPQLIVLSAKPRNLKKLRQSLATPMKKIRFSSRLSLRYT